MIVNEELSPAYQFITITDAGDRHIKSGADNQDAVHFKCEGTDFALAVADGVGSCALADVGSQAAVKAICEAFSDARKRDANLRKHGLVSGTLQRWMSMLPRGRIDDCCTTIKAAVCISGRLTLISLGDGLLAAATEDHLIIAPEDDESFANQTRCLCSETSVRDLWTTEIDLSRCDERLVILICTDGIANHLQENKEQQLLTEIAHNPNPKRLRKELESLVRCIRKFCDDDKTLGVVKHA